MRHGYRDNARIHTNTRAYAPARSLSPLPFTPASSSLTLALPPFAILSVSRSFSLVPARSRSRSLALSLVLAACTRRRRTSADVGEERHSRGENENAGAPRARGAARTGVDGCSAHGESGANTERGVTQGRQQNAGIGEAVTMTTVTGEVLVRIRDHAYVTTP